MVKEIESVAEFKELLNGDKPVLVDFHATWCGPCKQIAPFIEKMSKSEEFKEKIVFVKVDVDELSDISAEFGVRAMPTFMLLHKDEKLAETVGANPLALKAMLVENVSK